MFLMLASDLIDFRKSLSDLHPYPRNVYDQKAIYENLSGLTSVRNDPLRVIVMDILLSGMIWVLYSERIVAIFHTMWIKNHRYNGFIV